MLFLNQMEISESFKLHDHYSYATEALYEAMNNDSSSSSSSNDDEALTTAATTTTLTTSNKMNASSPLNTGITNLNINCCMRIATTTIPQQQQQQSPSSTTPLSQSISEEKSILNYCEEQIKENDEYKRAKMRRATSVKVSSLVKKKYETQDSNSSDSGDEKKPEKKVVRFADALGLDLVKVKMILNPDRPPRIPKHILKIFRDATKGSDDDVDDDYDDYEDDYNNDVNNNSKNNNYFNSIFGSMKIPSRRDVSSSSSVTTATSSSVVTAATTNATSRRFSGIGDDIFSINNNKYTLKWKQMFEQPGIRPDFYIKLNEKKVSLETVLTKSTQISGVVRVSNICYNKNVKIRYSTDKWATSTDVNAVYINNSCDGFTDRFSFSINFENSLTEFFNSNNSVNTNVFKIEFAVVYEISDNTFWDNNYGTNYIIECYNQNATTTSVKDIINDLSNTLSAAFV